MALTWEKGPSPSLSKAGCRSCFSTVSFLSLTLTGSFTAHYFLFTRLPDIVTISRALTEVGSTANKPEVGTILTSTSMEAAPSSLPLYTVNLNRYLKPGVRSPSGRVNRTNEVSLGLNTVNGVKPLRSTTAKPNKYQAMLSLN